ncbi:membrane lipoprotein lipid attachment site-containing protein [Virgibacillus pantothenticus]|nr:FxLYD domain-containing protein [Virgibacillus pantothenticus]MBU8601829.1 membrane lipoprotein lipid attachment site-containing protein [Virgibacillus pantothenticus]MBU8635983.1 membrane lipoprotein lipid attachment site-containing protein [Virgibacillus pantothenticus]MBU8665427.1 membrane lipoprotein lipid attachment site-containing protein [Virgibacillus pantothenticus]MEB5452738.1 FxLYD domain-containing protein [Virgibacillus pantothenticus]MEB5460992.1 FxLYD domain-containing protei
MKKCIIAIFLVLLLSACSNEAKIEKLEEERDDLIRQGNYLEATEVQKEINGIVSGDEYERDPNPKETAEKRYQSRFEDLEFSNTKVNYNSITGDLTGEITNNGNKTLDGYFSVYFFDKNGTIVNDYMTHIPEGGINPGETKYFSIPINKFDYSYYEFQGETIIEN